MYSDVLVENNVTPVVKVLSELKKDVVRVKIFVSNSLARPFVDRPIFLPVGPSSCWS